MKLVSIPANPVPDDVITGALKTPDGVSLRFARWQPPAGRKGTVCIFQGRSESIEKYFETVRDLRSRGFAVATLDWRGQGLSDRALKDRRKGYVRDFADYDTDLGTFMREIVLPDCPPPLFAIAHSMGATALIRAAYQGQRWFDRMVLVAPLIAVAGLRTNATVRAVLQTMRMMGLGSMYVPRHNRGIVGLQPFMGNIQTSDPVRFARNAAILEADPDVGLAGPTVDMDRCGVPGDGAVQRAELSRPHPPADSHRRFRPRRRGLEFGDRGLRHAAARRLASHRGRRPA